MFSVIKTRVSDCELRKTVANLRHPRWGPA